MSAPVQGTNDSCTLSKAAMISKGYFKDPYVRRFVSAIVTRSPIINRGYFIRAYSLQALVTHLLKNAFYLDEKGVEMPIQQIVSLGAGFDTMYFRLRDSGAAEKLLKYVEVDTEVVIKKKKAIIEKYQLLEPKQKVMDFLMTDMNDTKGMFEKLLPKANPRHGTLVICEVSLVYLPVLISDRILRIFSEVYNRSLCLLYEQTNTRDPFGKFMMKHFQKLDCPLGSPAEYNTLDSVLNRMTGRFARIMSADLNHITVQILPPSELERISKIELFDEFEELVQLNSHYAMTLMTTKDITIHNVFPPVKDMKCQCCCSKKLLVSKHMPKVTTSRKLDHRLQLFKHCSVMIGTRLFLVGGFGTEFTPSGKPNENHPHCRLKYLADMDITDTGIDAFKCVRNFLWERLHAVMEVCDDSIIVFGGRLGPAKALNDLIRITVVGNGLHVGDIKHFDASYWRGLSCHPCPRFRHASAVFEKNYGSVKEFCMLVDGGKDKSQSFKDAFVYNHVLTSWSEVSFMGKKLPPRHSHSICYWNDLSLLLSGGVFNNSETDINNKLYHLNFSTTELCSVEVLASGLPPQFGHTSHVYTDSDEKGEKTDWLLLVGGVVPVSPFSLIQIFNLNTKQMFRQVRVHDCLMINHSSHVLGHRLFVVGGGGNLFSFGTYFNKHIKIYSIQEIKKMSLKGDQKKKDGEKTQSERGSWDSTVVGNDCQTTDLLNLELADHLRVPGTPRSFSERANMKNAAARLQVGRNTIQEKARQVGAGKEALNKAGRPMQGGSLSPSTREVTPTPNNSRKNSFAGGSTASSVRTDKFVVEKKVKAKKHRHKKTASKSKSARSNCSGTSGSGFSSQGLSSDNVPSSRDISPNKSLLDLDQLTKSLTKLDSDQSRDNSEDDKGSNSPKSKSSKQKKHKNKKHTSETSSD